MRKLVEHYKSLLNELVPANRLAQTIATAPITPQLQSQHPELFPDKIPGRGKKSSRLVGIERAKKIAPGVLQHQQERMAKVLRTSEAQAEVSRLPIKDEKTEKTIRPAIKPADNASQRKVLMARGLNMGNIIQSEGKPKISFTMDKNNPEYTPVPRIAGEKVQSHEMEINLDPVQTTTPIAIGGINPERQDSSARLVAAMRGSAIQGRRQEKAKKVADAAAQAKHDASIEKKKKEQVERLSSAMKSKNIQGFV